jgi:phage replication-related protein YjqB (UPF0714/DUF867 family)
MSPDRRRNYAALAAHEQEGRDYVVRVVRRDPRLVVAAPHGGGIEAGTSEIATEVAGDEWSLYCFEGIKSTGNRRLHITSTHFNEPRCLALVGQAQTVLTIHGLDETREAVWIGGLDEVLSARLQGSLTAAGFETVLDDTPAHGGAHPNNICNMGASHRGCQLEISLGLLRKLFAGLNRAGRRQPTSELQAFCLPIRQALIPATRL